MNWFQALTLRFQQIPNRQKQIILISILGGFMFWWLLKPNPNGWQKVPEMGITIPLKYKIHGIDISKHNDVVNWKKVKSMTFKDLSIEFAFIKATEGTSLVDKQFQRNWNESQKVGLRRGAYHFYIPWKDPVSQANNFVKTVSLNEGDLAPVLDVESNSLKADKQIIAEIDTWLKLVGKHYGKKPIIYTNPNFYRKFIKGNFDEYPLWIADYSKENLSGYPKGQLYFWQHTQKAWVQGIRGTVDFNVFLQSESELEGLCL